MTDFDVLVVDDDFMVARLHSRYLATVPGFRVVDTVHSGRDALATLERRPVDLVLLDVYLPDLTGIEVLRQIRARHPAVDVLMVTAARELDTVREALQGGAVAYLIKPFEYQALGERLEHFRRARNLLRAGEPVDQQQVDRLFGLAAAGLSPELPKGLGRETADAVRRMLSTDCTLSAAECAEKVGLSRVSARRYLEYWEQRGIAEVSLKYGAGRPERRYRLR